ncbi:UDP-4-amino-4,6-dideoxy-N-acetyl-beta-L-altrosamine transaminase [Hyphomicrobium sp. xq]|uniref:UDP-4-amino-4, 6-dideoxy-N-acetyl-beta-L-altrosamine transaminase n=1 Tax=Hyphomicrobium album TaxID=2665159 RepID=A0A6I3KL63_9HYPH|nr:UDP-4-amino-4,6-dideoxy-N-acetyl-beta-L-altrosamine transaminase [Hyphomicrobium album]MTD94680.1 UDP-4-amino-4,6-dideoxy-N-acetyl-beta-L-altrosamine transaminase [Hyphomicrobium album]
MIPYGRQDIDEADIDAVVKVLRSDWLTQGPSIQEFETTFAVYCGAAHAVAVSSATAGLHLAVKALGLKSGGLLWTVPNTFVATANVALYCGADVDFVDIDPNTYCISVQRLRERLAAVRASGGRLPDIVTVVHFAGQPCEMQEIRRLAKEFGFRVIEDASHAVGAEYMSRKVGSCDHSDLCVFSFHPVKIVTTGEGGMVTTSDPFLATALAELRTHGITRDPQRMESASQGAWYYEMLELGFNYRITDMQAALGCSQMRRLDDFVARRRKLAATYNRELADLPIRLPYQHPDGNSSFHLYPIVVEAEQRARIFAELRSRGIGVNVHYIPVYTQPVYRRLGFEIGYCPSAEAYYAGAISLPLFSRMSDDEQNVVMAAVRDVVLHS